MSGASAERPPGFPWVTVTTSALESSETSRRIDGVTSAYSSRALDRLREHREAIRDVLARYGASNPRLFGSIAQGTAGPDSDIDLLLDLTAEGSGSRLSRLSGIRLELEELLKIPVDVVCEELLKDRVSESARSQAIAL
jgi:predicted nucleotidyltransferase